VNISITFDRLRWEEKKLKEEAERQGYETELIDSRKLAIEISSKKVKNLFGNIVLQRCISHYRSVFLTKILENYGVRVVNPSTVSEACGNKLITTMLLTKAGIPTPKTYVALSAECALTAGEGVGFPVVLKPFTGSWGRMVSIANDAQTLATIVELRELMQNPLEHMYYIQEFVKRPPRDIRIIVAGDEIVASVYRHAPQNDWRTNVARGATTTAFKPDDELSELALRAAKAVGGGILGVDAMESNDGYLIHEINNTVEFKGAQASTKTRIARKIINYAVSSVKR
jgi:[lysine-biosynthesis-protein LysW]--L-2-aminoadipate ligase